MSAKMKDTEKRNIIECIRLYRNLPALWRVKSEDYTNREKKNRAYRILIQKFREMNPTAGRDDVARKFNALRTNFRKELRKVNESRLDPTKPRYEPRLYYFEEMLFLQDQDNVPLQTETDEIMLKDDIVELTDYDSPVNETSNSSSYVQSAPKQNPIKTCIEDHQDEMDSVSVKPYRETTESDFDKLTIAWAVELQNMAPIQQIFAKKAINDILFEGQMGTLHRHSVVINGPMLPDRGPTIEYC